MKSTTDREALKRKLAKQISAPITAAVMEIIRHPKVKGETQAPMSLKSVYLKDSVISVATFVQQVKGGKLIPLDVWRSSSIDFGLVNEVKKDSEANQIVVVSPDTYSSSSEPTSFLEQFLKRENVWRVSIADRFEPAQGLAVLWQLQQYDGIDCSHFKGWAKMQEEIQRLEKKQSVAVLAFLQGIAFHQLHPAA
ncbi:MAG: hypothetical protein AAFV46_00730 [Cyanobacteria bacterium J06635_11]